MTTAYIEMPSDHDFTAFLARMTPSRALRDRERTLSREEKRRQVFLREKEILDGLVASGRIQRWQVDVTLEVAEARARKGVRRASA